MHIAASICRAVSTPQTQSFRSGPLAHVVLLLLARPGEHARRGDGVEVHTAEGAGACVLPALACGLVYKGGLAEGAVPFSFDSDRRK